MPQKGSQVRHVHVSAAAAGQRVDNFLLRELKGVPRSHIYRLLRTGQVRVNGGRVKANRKLAVGETLRIPPWTGGEQSDAPPPSARFKARVAGAVFHEDDRLIALDKPAGMAVHGGAGVPYGVIETLRIMRPDAPFLELVHRLDRATSGCLLIAKDRKTLTQLHEALREGRVQKRYLGLMCGAWDGGAQRVDLPLGRAQRNGEKLIQTDLGGKAAVTWFYPRRQFNAHLLADIDIDTGRMHQIRVHASALAHPVAGDNLYGDRQANQRLRRMGLKRMFLHAVRFKVVLEGRALSLEAPPGEDFSRALELLGE